MRLIILIFLVLFLSCHSTRVGHITYGRNYKAKQTGSLDAMNNDSVNLYVGFLHKGINRNPNKDYVVYGCCYDSFYNHALNMIKPHLQARQIRLSGQTNLRREELVEELLRKLQKNKEYLLPPRFRDTSKGILIVYFKYNEADYITGVRPAPGGGVTEGKEVSNVSINADLIYIKNNLCKVYKNVYVSALERCFNPNSDAIWKRLINHLFK